MSVLVVGSTEKVTHDMWVYDEPMDKIVKRPVTYVPGLYKIFDEIIVNAADNKQRDPDMSKLKVHLRRQMRTKHVPSRALSVFPLFAYRVRVET